MAQLLIKKHLLRIVATRYKSCGECVEFAFRATPGMRAEIEVPELSDGGKIRSDVVVYKNDERHVSFEVKHTHATRAVSRGGLHYLEVNAGHVVSQFENCRSAGKVRLKCDNSTTPCTDGCSGLCPPHSRRFVRPEIDRKGDCAGCNGLGLVKGYTCIFCSGTGNWDFGEE